MLYIFKWLLIPYHPLLEMLIATVKELHSSLLDYYLFSLLTLAHSHCHQCFLDNPSWSLSVMLLTYRMSYLLFLISTTLPFLLLTLATWSLMPFPEHTLVLNSIPLPYTFLLSSFTNVFKVPFAWLENSHKAFKTKPKLHLVCGSLSEEPQG